MHRVDGCFVVIAPACCYYDKRFGMFDSLEQVEHTMLNFLKYLAYCFTWALFLNAGLELARNWNPIGIETQESSQ
jgi:hypothetical protein